MIPGGSCSLEGTYTWPAYNKKGTTGGCLGVEEATLACLTGLDEVLDTLGARLAGGRLGLELLQDDDGKGARGTDLEAAEAD